MDEQAGRSPLLRILDVLWKHDVKFVLIGGQAEAIMGSPRVTYDVDVCYARSPDNLVALANALRELGVTLRGAPADLPFRIDPATLQAGCNFTFDTPMVPFDILGEVEPIGGYEALLASSERVVIEERVLHHIALEDLIRVKQHIKRPKDGESLMQLLAIKRLRDGGQI